jgi:hypothetical protein
MKYGFSPSISVSSYRKIKHPLQHLCALFLWHMPPDMIIRPLFVLGYGRIYISYSNIQWADFHFSSNGTKISTK